MKEGGVMTRFWLLFLIVFTSAHVQAASDQDLARMFYPPALTTWIRDHPGLGELQQWNAAPADLDRSGNPNYLVVAYSNGHIGRLRVIKKTPSGPVLVSDPDSPALYETHPLLRLLDLNGDGKPEIIATYHIGNHGESAAWIFTWTGNALQTLNPPDPERTNIVIAFRALDFVDFNGDGTLEVVEPTDEYGVHVEFATPEERQSVVPNRSCNVYQLGNGRYVSTERTATYYGHFARTKGTPAPSDESFSAKPGKYVLRIANGEQGKNLVDSAEIQLNGLVILPPAAFNNQRAVITVPVTLREQNTLRVELRSAPGSTLRVVIEPAG